VYTCLIPHGIRDVTQRWNCDYNYPSFQIRLDGLNIKKVITGQREVRPNSLFGDYRLKAASLFVCDLFDANFHEIFTRIVEHQDLKCWGIILHCLLCICVRLNNLFLFDM